MKSGSDTFHVHNRPEYLTLSMETRMQNTGLLFLVLLLLFGCSDETTSPSPEDTRNRASNGSETAPGSSFPVISHGQEVELSEHAVDGKYTVFKFTADW